MKQTLILEIPDDVYQALQKEAAQSGKSLEQMALDWRGHGRSETPAGDFGASDLVENALAVIAASGAQNVVPVALSHAGWVAIELRRRLGARIPKLVLLDWIILDAPPPFLGALQSLQDSTQWQHTREQLFGMWLEGVDSAELTRFICEDMGSYPFAMWARAGCEIVAAYTEAGSPLRALATLDPPVPVLHLYAQPDDPGYLSTLRRNWTRRCAWWGLLYHSRDDSIVPFSHMAVYHKRIPRAEPHELDGLGHTFAQGDRRPLIDGIRTLMRESR